MPVWPRGISPDTYSNESSLSRGLWSWFWLEEYHGMAGGSRMQYSLINPQHFLQQQQQQKLIELLLNLLISFLSVGPVLFLHLFHCVLFYVLPQSKIPLLITVIIKSETVKRINVLPAAAVSRLC